MVDQIETFGLNVHEGFNCDDVHLKIDNLTKDSRWPVVGSISTPNGPSAFESIAMPNDLDEESKIAWEVLKVQFILNLKARVLHCKLFIP
jgi:hypothetical protein